MPRQVAEVLGPIIGVCLLRRGRLSSNLHILDIHAAYIAVAVVLFGMSTGMTVEW